MAIENEIYPVLKVIVRNDLPSMNPGKAEAHSGHAACAFYYEMTNPSFRAHMEELLIDDFEEWQGSTLQGFGTQINLNGSLEDMESIKHYLDSVVLNGITWGFVTDPTYPYFSSVTGELLLRKEITAFYIFGMSDNIFLNEATKNLGLKP